MIPEAVQRDARTKTHRASCLKDGLAESGGALSIACVLKFRRLGNGVCVPRTPELFEVARPSLAPTNTGFAGENAARKQARGAARDLVRLELRYPPGSHRDGGSGSRS